jgi:hypothetical protein
MVPGADGFNVHVDPLALVQPPHTSGVAEPHEPFNVNAVPTVPPLEPPDMEQAGVTGPPPASEQVIVVPLPVHVTLLGSEIVRLVCACAPKPRVIPHAADAAHNSVRKRIMNLSLYFPRLSRNALYCSFFVARV